MTTRVYFTDAMAREFDATVAACAPAGDRFDVILDRTAFYPESGGQPPDTGVIGSARVLDVQDDEAGVIHHVTDAPIAPGAAVHGSIDWPRRLDHMQQHTGQHILSAAFDRLCHVRTTSFHLGALTSTIDLAREVTPDEIARAEREANQVVWDARPVSVRFVTEEEAARLPLRKEPVKTGRLRLVDIDGFDLSACGGTHVPQTGLVGAIAVAGWERFKGATRLTFVCGARALRSHAALREVVTAATRTLSVLPGDLAAAIERLQAEVKAGGREVRRLQEEVAMFRAAGLRAAAETIGPVRGVLSTQAGWDAAALKTLALAIVSEPGLVVVLTGDGSPVPVVAARSAGVTWDAGAWMKQATADLGGRGGGRPELAQGGLPTAPDRVLAFARQTLASFVTLL
jgi:alanyl-tRNA synthetase